MPTIQQEPQQRGLRIPANVNAPLARCLTMQIPDDPTYIEHVIGALSELGSGWMFQNDPDMFAQTVAQQWKNALDTIKITEGTCAEGIMQLRACSSGCGIEYSTDGLTWTCIELSDCIGGLVQDGIQNAINDGVLGRKGTQGGPHSPPAVGQCTTYHVVLRGNDQWHCPSPIASGDTVHVLNATGGWTDGSLNWFCPDGSRYALGRCYGDSGLHEGGDPVPDTAFHMTIIGHYGSTYFDPMTGVYTVPNGVSASDLTLQANDGTLADNGGEVEFDIEVCKGTEGFRHIFDFTGGDAQGFTLGYGQSAPSAPSGWGSIYRWQNNSVDIEIGRYNQPTVEWTRFELEYEIIGALPGGPNAATVYSIPISFNIGHSLNGEEGVHSFVWTGSRSIADFGLQVLPSYGQGDGPVAYIRRFTVEGPGSDPY